MKSARTLIGTDIGKATLSWATGEVAEDGRLVLSVPDQYSLQPILDDEANWVDVSTDLKSWRRLSYLAGTTMTIDLDGPARYLRFQVTADRFVEISGERDGQPMDRNRWRASNLFAHPSEMRPVAAWHGRVRLEGDVDLQVLDYIVAGFGVHAAGQEVAGAQFEPVEPSRAVGHHRERGT